MMNNNYMTLRITTLSGQTHDVKIEGAYSFVRSVIEIQTQGFVSVSATVVLPWHQIASIQWVNP
jgi:hypothetical protein